MNFIIPIIGSLLVLVVVLSKAPFTVKVAAVAALALITHLIK